MTGEVYERIRRREGANGQGEANRQGPLKQSATGIRMPPMALEKRAYTSSVSVPDVRPLGRDRRSRREADETRRELGHMAHTAVKVRFVIDAQRTISIHGIHSIDQAQDEMMDVLYSKERHEGVNELLAQVIAQSVQQLVAQTMALAELHYKRQTEAL